MSSPIVPCVWLVDQAEAAAAFYAATFPASKVTATSHYPAQRDNPSGLPPGSVLTVELEVAGQTFSLLNGGAMFKPNPSISFFVNVDSAAEVDRLFAALADGGQTLMGLDKYPWSERYGWVQDRYGVSWQVMATDGKGPTIVPALMFAEKLFGRADEAMKVYTGIFPGSRIERVERYGQGEGADGAEGKVKHGRFVLAGQPMAIMDAHGRHGFTFDEGLSLQVMCADQAEVDRYWDALPADGGSTGPCGWVKDRFGVSWQVVPAQIRDWMTSTDTAAKDRAFMAMMWMQKPLVDELDKAFRGA